MLKQRDGSASTPLFQIRDAEVVRAGKTILHVDEFSLDEGEHVALLGPNGAGKSTFIQLLTREVFPLYREEPPVRFRGKERPLLEDIRSALGIVSATMHDQVRVHLPAIEIVMEASSARWVCPCASPLRLPCASARRTRCPGWG